MATIAANLKHLLKIYGWLNQNLVAASEQHGDSELVKVFYIILMVATVTIRSASNNVSSLNFSWITLNFDESHQMNTEIQHS